MKKFNSLDAPVRYLVLDNFAAENFAAGNFAERKFRLAEFLPLAIFVP